MATRPPQTPQSTESATILPASGSSTNVASACPLGVYSDSDDFLNGAAAQVSYVYKKLGGDILDLEITEGNVYAAYEEAVLEYSYIVNVHQSKNVLSNVLGNMTGTFDHKGELRSGDPLSSSLEAEEDVNRHGGAGVSSKYMKFKFEYAKNVGKGFSNDSNMGGYDTVYSASFQATSSVQDYDLQAIIASQSLNDDFPYYNKVGTNKVLIRKVYYKTNHAAWRFYGYYGGLNTVGNLQSYGQFADDSQFQIVPVWQNKQQAHAFEDAIYTRNSHYSYELKNNKLRIFPTPVRTGPSNYWVEFVVPGDKNAWDKEHGDIDDGSNGVNNMNTIPFGNIPFIRINSIGKQWIRRFSLSLCKETLGLVRGKFATIPIPGESVTLNGADLVAQAKDEQEKLREELKTVLDEMTYEKLVAQDASIAESVGKVQEKMPLGVYTG